MSQSSITLKEYLARAGMTMRGFAARVGCAFQMVQRYVARGKIPRRETMRRIFVETGGQVDANAFYGLNEVAEDEGWTPPRRALPPDEKDRAA